MNFNISVTIANYNHGKYIGQALEAILSQSCRPIEVIVVDDASTDNSVDIIEQFVRRDSVVRLIKNPQNMGVIYSSNLVHRLARGDYLLGNAADDYILPGVFEKAALMATKYPQAGIIFGQFVVVDEDGTPITVERAPNWHETRYVSPQAFLDEYIDVAPPNHSLCGSTIYKVSALKEIDYLRPELKSWADTFAARAIALKYGGCYLPEPLYCWRYLRDSFSNSNAKNPQYYLDIIDLATNMMSSPEYSDRFPAKHVASWADKYRHFLLEPLMTDRIKRIMQLKNEFTQNIAE